jgi:hypothetical protein
VRTFYEMRAVSWLAEDSVVEDSVVEDQVVDLAELLSIGEVARRRGVVESTIRAYLSRRQMPAADYQIGRSPYWRPESLRGFVRGG